MRRVFSLTLGLLVAACAARQQPMGPAIQAPQMTGDAIIAADGYRLPLRRRTPEPGVPTHAVIVALHGFNDYSNAFDGTGHYFVGRGVAVYAYDQRGFGATRDPGVWAGSAALTADAQVALRLIAAAHPGLPLYLLGESMGGAVAVRALTGPDAPDVAGAILVAPAVWGFPVMGFWPKTALKLAYAALPGMVATAPAELNIRPSDNIEMLKALGADPLVIKGSRIDTLYGLTQLMGEALVALPDLRTPTFAAYGAHEEVLPQTAVARARAALTANPAVTLKLYPEGRHMLLRDLQGIRVLEDIGVWIDARLTR